MQSLDIYTGLTSVVQRSRSPILYWTTDRAGVVRFGSGYDNSKSTFITRDSAEASWRTLAKWELGENDFDVVGFGPTPGTLLVSAAHNGREAIFEMDLNEKSSRQLLFAERRSRRRRAYLLAGRPPHRRFQLRDRHAASAWCSTQQAKDIFDAIDTVLPNADNRVVDSSSDGRKLLIASSRDVRPTDYHLLDLDAEEDAAAWAAPIRRWPARSSRP